MLCLMFTVSNNRYAIAAHDVVEVLPYAPLEFWPGTAACVAGMLAYRGLPVPVVDLTRLSSAASCPVLWNTRIIVVRRPSCLPAAGGSSEGFIGLLVHRVSTCPMPDAGPEATGQAAQWGRLEHDAQGFYQRIDLTRLIPAAFGEAAGGNASGVEQRRTAG